MPKVNGIIVHQTHSTTAQATFNGYSVSGANGAHFLIDKDGAIYQTASVFKKTNHVGRLKARCVVENCCRETQFDPIGTNKIEQKKISPFRYPANKDSIGIELVGKAYPVQGKKQLVFEKVTAKQNVSLKWLIGEISITLGVPMTEIFKHPEVSYKNETEAETARW